MRYTKIFTKNITVTDSKLLFTGNLDATILEIFNNSWKGKCMNGVYVVSADKVVRRSQCLINNRSLQGHCTISVELEVSTLVYEQGDVMVGTVVAIDISGDFILTSADASMSIGANNILKPVQVGDKLPMYVVQTQYTLGKLKLSAIGVPFVAQTNVMTYNVIDDGAENLEVAIEGFLTTIANLENTLASYEKNNAQVYSYFTKLLRRNIKVNGKPIATIITTSGLISRPRYCGNIFVINADKSTDSAHATYVSQPRIIVAEQLLTAYIKELATTITLIENYNTMDIITKHAHIMSIYK